MKVSLKFLPLVILLAVTVACGDSNDDGTPDPFDPNAYFDDSPPDDGGAPVKECVTDLQCTGGKLCVAGKCFTPSDKKPGDSDKKKACVINYDCSAGEKCNAGVCQKTSSSDSGSGGSGKSKKKKETSPANTPPANGGADMNDGSNDSVAFICTQSSDCAEGHMCVDGSCVKPADVNCSSDSDCKDDFVCKDGACFAGCVYDFHCNKNGAVGEVCANNQCTNADATCYIDAQCNANEKCLKNTCVSKETALDCEANQECNYGQFCDMGIKQCIVAKSCDIKPCSDPGMICDDNIGLCVTNLAPDTATFKDGNSYFMVFGKNASGKLATAYRDAKAETWNDPTPLESAVAPSSNSIAVFNGANGNIEVFARDDKDNKSTNSKILHWYFDAKTRTWSKGSKLSGTYNARGNPTAVYNPAYKAIEVFAKNDVGELLYWYWTAESGWSSVQIVSVVERIHDQSSPTAFYYPQHRNTHIFARSPDDRLYHWRRDTNVHPEQTAETDADDFLAAPGQIGNQPSVTFQGAHGGIWISAVTTDKKISLLVYDLNWGSWYTLATLGSGTNADGRTAIVYNPKTTDVEIFATGTDHDVYRWYWDSTKGIENGHQKMIGHATKKDVVAAYDHHLGAIRVFVHGDGSTFKQLVANPNNPNTFKADKPIALAEEPSVMVYPPLEASRYHGGDGGGKFSILCPEGSIAIGLRAKHGSDVDQIGLVCKDLATGTIYKTKLSNGEDGGEEKTCPDSNYSTGILINAFSGGDYYDSYGDDGGRVATTIIIGSWGLGLGPDYSYEPHTWIIRGLNGQCGFLNENNGSDADGVSISVGDYLGNYGGLSSNDSSDVPEGAVITGIQGASGDRLDRFNFLYKIIDVTK